MWGLWDSHARRQEHWRGQCVWESAVQWEKRETPCSTSLPGRGNCSKQHPFCATAMEIIKSATDWDQGEQPLHGLDRPAGDRGANSRLSCSRNDGLPDLLGKTWIKSTAKICFFFLSVSHWGSLMLSIKTHAAVQRRLQRAGSSWSRPGPIKGLFLFLFGF